ncbi:hypothetical protein PD374_17470 [Pseudomonas sp. WCS374]|nr:hypothetical protein PD374_17470 [Pseudomonas sp. WCS374]
MLTDCEGKHLNGRPGDAQRLGDRCSESIKVVMFNFSSFSALGDIAEIMQDYETVRADVPEVFQGAQHATSGLIVICQFNQTVKSAHTTVDNGFNLGGQWVLTFSFCPLAPDFSKENLMRLQTELEVVIRCSSDLV